MLHYMLIDDLFRPQLTLILINICVLLRLKYSVKV